MRELLSGLVAMAVCTAGLVAACGDDETKSNTSGNPTTTTGPGGNGGTGNTGNMGGSGGTGNTGNMGGNGGTGNTGNMGGGGMGTGGAFDCMPTGDMCQDCIGMNCCNEAMACQADMNCQCLFQCVVLNMGNLQMCIGMCGAPGMAATAAYQCAQGMCGTECGI